MKRLLILGASALQVPAIVKAKQMGLTVAVADYDPCAVGIALADAYYHVSTIDEEGVYRAAKDFGANGIMTLATDMPMRALAHACERLGLPGIDLQTALRATDKGEMIRAFEEAGVAHPWYFVLPSTATVSAIADRLSYPCISKPADSSGSRGVMFISGPGMLEEAIAYSARCGRSGTVIIEEYLCGPEVSVEVFVLDGQPHVLQVTDKLTTGVPHFVEMGHSQPSGLCKEDIADIGDLACRAALAIGIYNGPAHAEIVLTMHGPVMIEIGARMGGDCITTHLLPLSTGIDMVQATIELALGRRPVIAQKWNRGAAIRYLNAPLGRITDIIGVEIAKSCPGVVDVYLNKHVGERSCKIQSSGDRIGYIIAQADTCAAAIAICESARRAITICTEQER